MERRRTRRHRTIVPLSRLFPNMVTIGGLCCGLSAIRFAFDQKFEIAVALLFAAALIDGLDGRIARFLNSASTFGAQLDSLSDFVCFGVSPGIVLFMWRLHTIRGLGWALVLFFAVCCALRLARFNTNMIEHSRAAWQNQFFVGIPSPAGAMLALMPLAIGFYSNVDFVDNAGIVACWTALVAILMASRVPTFAAKKIKIRHDFVLPVMLGCGAIIGLFVIEPWIMFTISGAIYCLLIVFSIIRYQQLAKAHKASGLSDGAAS